MTLGEPALEHLSPVERDCLARYVSELRQRLGERLLEVHLFGSFARGDAWRENSPMRSDVDILVVCTEPPSPPEVDALIDATYPLFLECGRQISPQFRTRDALEEPATDVGRAFLDRFREEGRLLFAAAPALRLVHVNLVVADPDASARFYTRFLLPHATRDWLGDSLHLRSSGCDLAFQRGASRRVPGAHHGFLADSAAAVDALAQRLREGGIALTADDTEEGFRSVKFLDPDGYECEVYWEAGWP